MLIGKVRGQEPNPADKKTTKVKEMTHEVKRATLEITEEFDSPIIAGMDFGHYTPNLPLPMGSRQT